MNLRSVAFLIILTGGLLLSACSVYKIDVQQGNEITPEMVSNLEIGMTKREVTQLLGYPLVNDPFHKDRWDYYYSFRNGETEEVTQQTASLKFSGDLLSEVTSSFE